jgi:hypothetical protein
MLQGGLGTLGIVTDPIAAGADWLANKVAPPERSMSDLITGNAPQPRRLFGTAREGATALADTLGLPTPQTGMERLGGGITEALTGGGGLIGVGRGLAMRAPGIGQAAGEFLSSNPGSQLAALVGGSGAQGAARESGAGEGAQFAASLVGGLSPSIATAAGSGLTRLLVRGTPEKGEAMRRMIDDFASVGAEPSVGQATGNRRTQGMESLLAGSPTGVGPMTSFAGQQAEALGAGLGRRADQISSRASGENAGRAIERGAEVFADNTKATKRALYWQADQFIPSDTQVGLPNTWQTIVHLTTPAPGAAATTGAMVNSKIAGLRQTLEQDLAAGGGRITYDALKRVRSDIGEAISDFSLSPDTPTREYKALYAALSRDMEEAAAAQGPEAVAAAKRANTYTRAAADRLETVQRVIDKNGGPEKVFTAATSGTKEGATTLRAVMQSLPVDGQKAVTAAVIKRMGLATPGNQNAAGEMFSAGTFLTNWNNLSVEARRALFDRYGPEFSKDMDKIARVADRIKSGSKVFANPSGSAHTGAAYAYYGGLVGAGGAAAAGIGVGPLAGLVLGGLSANVAARALTNPRFVRWLAKATEYRQSVLPQQIVVLKGMAQTDPDIAAVVNELQAQEPENNAGNRRKR